MIALDGYTIRKSLRETSRSQLQLATRDADGREVWIRCHRAASSEDQLAHTRREHEVLTRAAGPGVIGVLELAASSAPALLVLDPLPGLSLDAVLAGRRPSPLELLEMAVQIAAALQRVHEARWVHRDLQPCNLSVEPRTRRAGIHDFAHALPYGAGTGEARENWRGNLHYAAPEQMGRMNRGVDFRSDLYSLGATLYHAFTGETPFQADDALGLIHAHMARLPKSPIERCGELPPTLSRIVMKLLQKEPEERYQSAHSLHRDLSECLQQLQRTGSIDDGMLLGTFDAPLRPLFTKRLYGRETEIAALHAAYARAAAGRSQLLLLSGAPGMGKSALVHELRRELARTDGYLALGKFDLYRSTLPYAGFSRALQSLVDQMLVESEANLQAWRERLRSSLGSVAGTLVELVPELRHILGDLPALPSVGPGEARARLALAVERFVHAVATPEHPLVLVLDDLQWADAGSWYLLEDLLANEETPALLVIGAYRDGEVDAAHPVHGMLRRLEHGGAPLTTLEIRPLAADAVARMLADALDHPVERVQSLADVVARKTGAAPLLIQQFVGHLHELGVLRFAPGRGWAWDDATIAAARIPEGAVALLVAKLERLDARARSLLQFASCIGDEFDRATISTLIEDPIDVLEPALFTLAAEGLLAPSASGFRFVHDRIREAAQALLEPRERAVLHRSVARLLLARTPLEQRAERSLEIADHLNRAGDLLEESERRAALEINRIAGERALAAGAAATASGYLAAARARLVTGDWERDPASGLALLFAAAEAAYQTEALPLALELLDQLQARPLTRMQRAQAWAKRLRVLNLLEYSESAEHGESARLTLLALREFGVRWPARPSIPRLVAEILLTDWLLRGPLDARLFPVKPGRGEDCVAPLIVFEAGASALCREAPGLMLLGGRYALRTMRRHGPLLSPGYNLAGYAAFRVAATLRTRGIERIASAALDWMARVPHALNVRGELVLQSLVYSWIRPRSAVVNALKRVGDRAREQGDTEFFIYTERICGLYSLLSGAPLPALIGEMERLARRDAFQGSLYFWQDLLRLYGLLRSEAQSPDAWRDVLASTQQRFANSVDPGIHTFWTLWITVFCILGQYEAASELAERVAADIFRTGVPGSSVVDFMFVRGLTAAGLAERSQGRARRGQLRVLRRCARRVRSWIAGNCDFEPMALFLEAERARLRADVRTALRVYTQAARGARKLGYLHHAALVHERRAALLAEQRRTLEAASALAEAQMLYAEWGATGKARALAGAVKP